MKFYQITANGARYVGSYRQTFQVPTFYLRDDMQGIVSTQAAERIANAMLLDLSPDCTFYVSASESREFDPSVIGA